MSDPNRPSSRRDLRRLGSLSLLGAALGARPALAGPVTNVVETDICIYGATSAGVAAAVQARRMGKRVALVEAGAHPGGMSSAGLGETDFGNRQAIGGIAREFYRRVRDQYVADYGADSPQVRDCRDGLRFEPHVAEKVFNVLLQETGVAYFPRHRLRSVEKERNRITRIAAENGRGFEAKVFIDATYEGDLMALAEVSYTVGREANSSYNETLNGVQLGQPLNNFRVPVDPYVNEGDPTSGLLKGISGEEPGKNGDGDGRVQAYCFRLCLSSQPGNRLPWMMPRGYDAERYALLARYIKAGVWDAVPFTGALPNGKMDVNNRGAVSLDLVGGSHGWPEGSASAREQIYREHLAYTHGLFWFLGHDERVPIDIRNEINGWGLSKDEFTDNGGWPHQLYVREARRMISEMVMTEHHCRGRVTADDSVGLASYTMDSHHVRRLAVNGKVTNEGDVQVGISTPYPISYRALTPRETECANLLVPVCLSASHIGYGSIRMEPVFIILGQSAATAAVHAIEQNSPVQRIDVSKLQGRLADDGQVLWATGLKPAPPAPDQAIDPKSLKGIVMDDMEATLIGGWQSTPLANPRRVGPRYLHDGNVNKGSLSVVFRPEIPDEGSYDVVLIFPPVPNAATNTPVTIAVDGVGSAAVRVNQQLPDRNGFISLGTFKLPKGKGTTVTVLNRGTDGYVLADAVQFIPLSA